MHLILKLILLFSFTTWCTNATAEAKVVLITGASRGVGLATAEYLAQKGYHVYAGVRNTAELLPRESISFERLDVTDLSTIQSVVRKIIQQEGRLDILINNAAYALAGPVESQSMEEMEQQMDVNFFGVIRMCQEVLPQMRKQKSGHIINISSEQGVYGLPYGSLYAASKAALESMSEALSIELLPWNIHVSIVEPGLITTNFSIRMGSRQVEDNPYQKIIDAIKISLCEREAHPENLFPSQTPQEIAEFLCQVIEDETPQLRYQTSEACREMVSMKLLDLSGQEYTVKMQKAWLETSP